MGRGEVLRGPVQSMREREREHGRARGWHKAGREGGGCSTLALLIEAWLEASSCLKGLGSELLQGESEEGDGAPVALPGAWSVLPPKPAP